MAVENRSVMIHIVCTPSIKQPFAFAFLFFINFLCKGVRDCTRCLKKIYTDFITSYFKKNYDTIQLNGFNGEYIKINIEYVVR